MDTDGRVAFRALWAGDEHALRQVVDQAIGVVPTQVLTEKLHALVQPA